MRVITSPAADSKGNLGHRLSIAGLLLALVAIGLTLRLSYARSANPYIDEYTTFWMAQRTIEYGVPFFPTGSLYSHGLLFTYLDALIISIFGFSELVARLPSVIIGVASIPLLYWVGKKIVSPWVGVIAAALLTLDPQAIIWGGRARNYTLLLFLLLPATLFFYQGVVRRDRALYRRLYILFFLLALFTHTESLLLFPAFLLCALLWRGWRWFLRPSVLLENLLCILGIGSNLYLWRLARPPGWQALGESYPNFAPSFSPLRALKRYSPFFLGPEQLPFVGLLSLLALVGAILILWTAWRRGIKSLVEERGGYLFLYLLFGLVFLEMIFLVSPKRWSARYLFMLSSYFFLMASGVVVWGVEGLIGHRERRGRVRGVIPLISTLLIVIAVVTFSLPSALSAASKREWGYNLAFQYLKEEYQEGDTVMTFWFPPCELYLEEGCDYVAVEEHFFAYVRKKNDHWIEHWGGVPLLTTDEELTSVIEEGRRVWFIIDEERFRTRYTGGFIQYVWDRMDLVAKEDGVFIFLAQNPPPPPLPLQRDLEINWGDTVALLGYGLSGDTFRPGEEMHLTLRWKGLTHIPENYSVFVHLLDAQNRVWAQDDNAPIKGLHPTNYWVAGEVIRDTHDITLAADIPPGRYRLKIGVYSPATMDRLPIDGSGEESATLDYIRVTKGEEEPGPKYPWEANLGDKAALLGYDLEVKEARPGDTLHLTLYWQAQREMDEDYTVFVHLIDEQGGIWGQKDGWPEGGFYPTSFWDPGEVVRDQYDLVIDPQVPAGLYRFEVGLYLLATGERLPIIEKGEVVGDRIILGEVEVR
ncbi:MAG: ArnT family glycosyltransferase [Anaerolineae bacterium]